MAVLPVKCSKCKNTVNVDPEKHGLKCPSCGIWINTVRELQAQHPKWTGLLEQEKKLNEEYTRLNEYESFYESDSSKAKRFFMKYKYAILMFIIDVAYIIFRNILKNNRYFYWFSSVGAYTLELYVVHIAIRNLMGTLEFD